VRWGLKEAWSKDTGRWTRTGFEAYGVGRAKRKPAERRSPCGERRFELPGPSGLNSLNRRMRTRLYGGVAGECGQPRPLCRFCDLFGCSLWGLPAEPSGRHKSRQPPTPTCGESRPAASLSRKLGFLRPVRKDDFAALAGEDENFAALDVGDDPTYEEIFAE
jgi:hypothetical protein